MPLRFIQCAARSCMPQLARMMTPDRRTSERTIIFAGTVPETTTKHLTQQPHVKNQEPLVSTHSYVIAGLDPAIQLFEMAVLFKDGYAGQARV